MFREEGHDVIFGLGQLDLGTVHKDLAALVVDLKPLCPEHAAGHPAQHAEAVGAQGGAHPGQQFAGAKGFGDVIVGSQIQRLDLVLLGGAGREHDDGGQELLPHKTDELQTVPVRQAQIQDDEIRIVGGEQGLAHGAGVGNKGLIAVGLQQRLNKAADVGLVFHDQNLEFVIAHLRFPPSQSIRSPARSGCWCPRPPCSRPGSRRRVP